MAPSDDCSNNIKQQHAYWLVSQTYLLLHFHLQSRSDQPIYLLPRLKTKFGERALGLSHAGPSAWNALSSHVRDVPNCDTFRKLLQTHFYSLALKVH